MSTTLITGGTVVNATGTAPRRRAASTARRSSPCWRPARGCSGTDLAADVDTVIDATGKYVIPGGIDAHTHMELPFGGTNASTRSRPAPAPRPGAARRSIIDFAVQRYGERVEDGLAAWHAKAAGNCAIDYGFHQIIGGVDELSLKAMDAPDRRGHHELQALHGVSGRLLLRRRADPARRCRSPPRPAC